MKIGDFPLVETLVDVRGRLIHQRDHGRISIEIDGRLLPPEFITEVTPAIRLQLRNEIVAVEDQLRDLGVQVHEGA